MMITFFYMQNHHLFYFSDGNSTEINCQAIEQYASNLKQIHRSKEWKTQGKGANFMGVYQDELDLDNIHPSDASFIAQNQMVYTAVLQQGAAVQTKSFQQLQQAEGLVLRHTDCTIHEISYDSTQHRLAMSLTGQQYGERNLAILPLDHNRFQFITEGECCDSNPFFDPQNSDILYYDSCGLAYTERGIIASPRTINRLNINTGELDNILSDERYDYFQPQLDQRGNLYCIRRPYQQEKTSNNNTLRDIVLAPVRIGKAIIGWLDFFTRRYSGESLKTSGANPAKSKQQSDEERFIEGNLIKVEQNRQKSQQDGDTYPSFIPKTWELIQITPAGETKLIKQGVMAFAIAQEGECIYSNGQFIIHNQHGQETMLLKAKWASKLRLKPQSLPAA